MSVKIPSVDNVTSWIADIIARQDGVIARHQALRSGMTKGQIRSRLESGRWTPVHPGVYAAADHQRTAAARVRAVGLWGGQQAFLSGVAAAWWCGLNAPPPSIVEIVIPRDERRRPRPGTRVIRRPLANEDRAWLRAAPVTGLALSTMTAAVGLGREGPALLDRTLQTRIGFADLRACHYRNLGMHGSARAGELLRAAADRSAAASERLFIGLLRAAGIRGWRVNHLWDPANTTSTVDVAFVAARVAIEIDGWAWHHTPDRFQRDRTKQNLLVRAGWTVLRFTWFDITDRPADVIAQVQAALVAADRVSPRR